MRTIIAGTRDTPRARYLICEAIDNCGFDITEVVSGHSGDVDLAGEAWGKEAGIPVTLFLAEWARLGKKAGPLRNQSMAEYVGFNGAAILIWDGTSPGTRDMLIRAVNMGLTVKLVRTDRERWSFRQGIKDLA